MMASTVLENGIRVLSDTMPDARTVAIGVLFAASPRDEADGKSGLAHLAEHMMFQGTGSHSANGIVRILDACGGQMGAFTTRDYTCFGATVLSDHLPYVLDLYGDMFLNGTLHEDRVSEEKGVILNETREAAGKPDERVHQALKERAWAGSRLGRAIEGRESDIATLDREDLVYFIHENYSADRMIVAAAGRIDHADFVAQVRDAFWRLGPGMPRCRETPPPFVETTLLIPSTAPTASFAFGMEAPAHGHAQRYQTHVLNGILGGGMSARLHTALRHDRGLVHRIGSSYEAYEQAGMIVVEGAVIQEDCLPVLMACLKEFERLARGDVSAEELWGVKRQLSAAHRIGSENTHTRMSRLLIQTYYMGAPIPEEAVLDGIEAVDLQSVNQACRTTLTTALSRLALVVSGDAGQNPAIMEIMAAFRHACRFV